MDTSYRDLSLSEISALLDIPDDVPDERIPLSIWMEHIKNYKLKDLTDGDIAKLIRQDIFLEYIIPEALQRIQIDPLAGSLGDGEIVEAFNYVEVQIWEVQNIELCKKLNRFLERFLVQLQKFELNIPYQTERFDEVDKIDLEQSVQHTLEKLNEAMNNK